VRTGLVSNCCGHVPRELWERTEMITSPSIVARFSRPCRLVRSGFSCGAKTQTLHQREEKCEEGSVR
jgi:hypothetical protein